MSEQQVIAQTKKEYPFRFFVEDRYSEQEVMECVMDLYQTMIDSDGLREPPSLGIMAHRFTMFFHCESIARVIYIGDYEASNDDVGMFSSYVEHIIEEYRESEESADIFIESFFEQNGMFPTNFDYFEKFQFDLRYAMEQIGLFFIDAQHSAEMFRITMFNEKLPPISSVLINCPITGVW